jgi:hypothetical protein
MLRQTSIFVLLLSSLAFAQAKAAKPKTDARPPANEPTNKPASKEEVRKQFALDVLKNAVALPVPDPQDRLRVLSSAVDIARPLAPALAKQYVAEGARLEAELIARGEKPETSVLGSAEVDCSVAAQFVDNVAPANVFEAEDSLLEAFSSCPQQTREPGRSKVEGALDSGIVAPRALLSLIEADGATSRWSQAAFKKAFAALPKGKAAYKQPQDFAQLFERYAETGNKDDVAGAGVKMLDWLAQAPEGGAKNMAVAMTTDAMKKALGDEAYRGALQTDPVAQSLANAPAQPGQIETNDEAATPVLEALGGTRTDQTKRLNQLPVAQRAREAAAAGFASGTSGDRVSADHYFDIAYAALEQAWNERSAKQKENVTGIVQEVSEAAADVDAVAALRRAQGLQDPTAEAIAMLSVARVVAYAQ